MRPLSATPEDLRMCRIAAYLGPPCSLGEFLTAPEHSLYRQSWAAREMDSATVNADGWGAAWLAGDGRPAIYRHTLPIWADGNVDALARSLRSPLWLANVRSATTGLGTDHANTQPFGDGELLFTHNGFVDRFTHTLRTRIRSELDAAIEVDIAGNTDSEYLFALIRQQQGTLAQRLRGALRQVSGWLDARPDVRALLNVVISDGRQLVAVRAAVNAKAPSLYVNSGWHGGTVIASEAFDDDADWQPVAPQELIIVDPSGALERQTL